MSVFNPFCKTRKLMRNGGVGYSATGTIVQMVSHADAADTDTYNLGDFIPEAGKTYVVTVDGVTSTNIAERVGAIGAESIVLGNYAVVGQGDDTGESWIIVYSVEAGICFLAHKTKRYPETIALTIETETIHTIDPKYLVKEIDLSKYAVVDSSEVGTINEVILNLFVKGGGSVVVTHNNTFWDDISTDNPVRFVLDASVINTGLKIKAEAKSVANRDGVVIAIETSFMAIMNGESNRVTVTFEIADDERTSSTIYVIAEPLTIPA